MKKGKPNKTISKAECFLYGEGTFEQGLIIEDEFQETIQQITLGLNEKTSDELISTFFVNAEIIRTVDEKTDRPLVAVFIQNRKVGEFSEIDALDYSKELYEIKGSYPVCKIDGVIIRDALWANKIAKYDIKLDLDWPLDTRELTDAEKGM